MNSKEYLSQVKIDNKKEFQKTLESMTINFLDDSINELTKYFSRDGLWSLQEPEINILIQRQMVWKGICNKLKDGEVFFDTFLNAMEKMYKDNYNHYGDNKLRGKKMVEFLVIFEKLKSKYGAVTMVRNDVKEMQELMEHRRKRKAKKNHFNKVQKTSLKSLEDYDEVED